MVFCGFFFFYFLFCQSAESTHVLIGFCSSTLDIEHCVCLAPSLHTTRFVVANVKRVHYLPPLILRSSEQIGPDKITLSTPQKMEKMLFAIIRQSGLR